MLCYKQPFDCLIFEEKGAIMFFHKIIGKKIVFISLCCALNTSSSFGYNGIEAFLDAINSGNTEKIRDCINDYKEVKKNTQLLAMGLYVICSKAETLNVMAIAADLLDRVSATTKLEKAWLKFAYEMLNVPETKMDFTKDTPLAAAAVNGEAILHFLIDHEAMFTGKEKYESYLKNETCYKTPAMTEYIIKSFKLDPNVYAPEPVKNLKKGTVSN